MKQIIIVAITLEVEAGATAFVLTRSTARRKHRRPMTFWELYEDNLCSYDVPFD